MTADVEDTRDRGWEYRLPQQCLDSGSAISKAVLHPYKDAVRQLSRPILQIKTPRLREESWAKDTQLRD